MGRDIWLSSVCKKSMILWSAEIPFTIPDFELVIRGIMMSFTYGWNRLSWRSRCLLF